VPLFFLSATSVKLHAIAVVVAAVDGIDVVAATDVDVGVRVVVDPEAETRAY